MKKKLLIFCLICLLVTACMPFGKEEPAERVRIHFYSYMARETFEKEVKKPVEAMFADIELSYANVNGYLAMEAGYAHADIIHKQTYVALPHNPLKIVQWVLNLRQGEPIPGEDLTAYIGPESPIHSIDPQLMKQANWLGEEGKITVLPYATKPLAMFVNRSLLSERGLPLPEDGMSWEALADYLQHLPQGSKISMSPAYQFAYFMYQLSLPIGKSEMNPAEAEEKWRKLLRLLESVRLNGHEVNGMFDGMREDTLMRSYLFPSYQFFHNTEEFRYDEDWTIRKWMEAQASGVDLDAIAYPYFADNPRVGSIRVNEVMLLNPDSDQKVKAFQVMEYLVSPEIQRMNARRGLGPVQLSEEIVTEFGQDVALLQGKNLASFYTLIPPEIPEGEARHAGDYSIYYLRIAEEIYKAFKGETDVDTAISEIMKQYKPIIQ